MTEWLDLFEEAAEKIRKEVNPLFGSEKSREAMGRGAGGDITKYVDQVAEDIVVTLLEEANVSCILLSEEGGVRKIGKGGSDYVVLDAIDGTTNATRGIPFVSTSVAHSTRGSLKDIDVALIKDLYSGVGFSARKGIGAFQDNKCLSPSTVDNLQNAIVAVDLSCQEELPELMNRMLPILRKTLKIRIMGSTALEVCYVASGALDAFLDLRGITRVTDLAAAYFILLEAGGTIVTPSGKDLSMQFKADVRTAFISAANNALCKEVLSSLKIRKGENSTKTLSII